MDERDWLAERFQEQRPRLRAVTYRMLGSTSEADDAVQEAWIRLSRSNAGEIDNLEAWLVTAVGRVALNMLRARKTRRAGNVARRAMAFSQLGLVARPARINGAAGWVSLLDGEVYAIGALTLQNGRITTMNILLDPARLDRLDLTVFDSRP
jgi:DNA-directed RNA polymerase specialized sigma24 family protein